MSRSDIREFMRVFGISSNGLSKLLCVHRFTVYRWLAGKQRPTGTALAVMQFLSVLVSDELIRSVRFAIESGEGLLTLLSEIPGAGNPEALDSSLL